MVRIKQRYLLGELVFNEEGQIVDQKDILDALRTVVFELFGDMGLAQLKQNFISTYHYIV